jgi:hypothetical protein
VKTHKQGRLPLTIGLLVTVGVAACLDGTRGGPLSTQRRFTRADSAQLASQPRPSFNAVADDSCDGSTTACGEFLGATPGFFQGFSQPSSIELTFAGPIGSIAVVGSGAISCDGTFGTIVGYGADGSEIARAEMSLRDPADCSPDNNPDNVTFGAQGLLVTSVPIVRAVIFPMSLLSFPVFDLTGHASASYSVTYGRGNVPLEPPKLLMSCLPNPVERGQTVTCKGELKNGPAYTLLERRAKGKRFTITDNPNASIAAGQPFEWTGVAVAKTEVKFKISYVDGTTTKNLDETVTFDVARRGWQPMQLTVPSLFQIALYSGYLLDYPSNRVFGIFFFTPPSPISAPGGRATGGPNDGLWYFAVPIYMPQDPHSYTHPAMYAGQGAGRVWYNDQNGQGSGNCKQTVLPGLASMAEVHEGATSATNSHYGVANRVYKDEKLHVKFEELYNQRSESELQRDADNIFQKFWKTYEREQNAFDNTDSPRIFGSLGCNLDFNPKDK